jgi:hypothetical protein
MYGETHILKLAVRVMLAGTWEAPACAEHFPAAGKQAQSIKQRPCLSAPSDLSPALSVSVQHERSQWTPLHNVWALLGRLMSSGASFRVVDFWVVGCGLWVVDCGLWVVGCGL